MASFTLHGIPVSRGIAIDRAHKLAPAALAVKHSLVAEEHLEAEVSRLQADADLTDARAALRLVAGHTLDEETKR